MIISKITPAMARMPFKGKETDNKVSTPYISQNDTYSVPKLDFKNPDKIIAEKDKLITTAQKIKLEVDKKVAGLKEQIEVAKELFDKTCRTAGKLDKNEFVEMYQSSYNKLSNLVIRHGKEDKEATKADRLINSVEYVVQQKELEKKIGGEKTIEYEEGKFFTTKFIPNYDLYSEAPDEREISIDGQKAYIFYTNPIADKRGKDCVEVKLPKTHYEKLMNAFVDLALEDVSKMNRGAALFVPKSRFDLADLYFNPKVKNTSLNDILMIKRREQYETTKPALPFAKVNKPTENTENAKVIPFVLKKPE